MVLVMVLMSSSFSSVMASSRLSSAVVGVLSGRRGAWSKMYFPRRSLDSEADVVRLWGGNVVDVG
jgi:hypothetical protein